MDLRQSTAKTIRVGPFLDEDDGKSKEIALTIVQADIRLSKSGGAFAQSNDAGGGTHDENAWYYLQLNATDSATAGPLELAIHVAGALPVFKTFNVMTQNAYDSKYSTDKLEVDLLQIGGLSIAGNVATLTLKELNVQNSAGSAIVAKSTGGGGHGIEALGEGTGNGIEAEAGDSGVAGIHADGGTTGDGIRGEGGSSAGSGIRGKANAKSGGNTDGNGIIGEGYSGSTIGGRGIIGIGGAGSSTDSPGIEGVGQVNGDGIRGTGAGTGADISAQELVDILADTADMQPKLGTVVDLGDGTTLAANMTSLAGKTASAASYDRTTDSNEAIADSGGGGLTAQQTRDAMKLAPTGGAPAVGSVDEHLDNILVDTGDISAIKAVTDNNNGGIIDVNLLQINDVSVVGNLATLTLKELNVQNSTDSAVILRSSAAGKHGLDTQGGGSGGDGIRTVSGAGGRGIHAIGELEGIYAKSSGSGGYAGIHAENATPGGTNGSGFKATAGTAGSGAAHGLDLIGNGTGKDISAGEIDAILTDTTVIQPLVSANLDAAVSTRATQAQILSDATPFDGAKIDAAVSGIMTDVNLRDLLFNRDVVTRFANQKPQQVTVGTGGNQETVDMAQDGDGNTETEVMA